MSYVIGHNTPGYLPDNMDDELDASDSFDDAKRALIDEILWEADNGVYGPMARNALALAAEDVNLWSGPDNVTAPEADIAFWIMEVPS